MTDSVVITKSLEMSRSSAEGIAVGELTLAGGVVRDLRGRHVEHLKDASQGESEAAPPHGVAISVFPLMAEAGEGERMLETDYDDTSDVDVIVGGVCALVTIGIIAAPAIRQAYQRHAKPRLMAAGDATWRQLLRGKHGKSDPLPAASPSDYMLAN